MPDSIRDGNEPIGCDNLKQHYDLFNQSCREITNSSLSGHLQQIIGPSQSHLADIEIWVDVLRHRPECCIIGSAAQEYQLGLFAVTAGLYRYAFMALRLYYELSLSAAYLSALELDLRLRLKGERDVKWAEIIDSENGLFSVRFARAFCPGLLDEISHQRALAQKVYRECSEYVHGTPGLEQPIPHTLSFSEDIFREWHSKAATMRLTLTFALFTRYYLHLDCHAIHRLEHCILDEIGTIQGVRNLIDIKQRT